MDHQDIIKDGHTTWIHFRKGLSKKEQQWLAEKYNLSKKNLQTSAAGKSPRPKILVNKSNLFVIFHLPYLAPNTHKFAIGELDVFLVNGTLITVLSQGSLPSVNEFFDKTKASAKLKEARFKLGPAILFSKVILNILNHIDESIDSQEAEIERLNQEIFKKRIAKTFIEQLSLLRYNQTEIMSAMEPQVQLLTQLKDDNPLSNFEKDSEEVWQKILESLQNINHQVKNDSHHLERLVRTFESLITFKTNEIIKLLTIFSVILLPLTLISGVFGMNFRYIPFALHPLGFFFIITVMLFIALLMTTVFVFKKWL